MKNQLLAFLILVLFLISPGANFAVHAGQVNAASVSNSDLSSSPQRGGSPTSHHLTTPAASPTMGVGTSSTYSTSLLGHPICDQRYACPTGPYWDAGYMDQDLSTSPERYAVSTSALVAFPGSSSPPSSFINSNNYLAAGIAVQSQVNGGGVAQDIANFAMVYLPNSGSPSVIGEVWTLPDCCNGVPTNPPPSLLFGASWTCSCLDTSSFTNPIVLNMTWNSQTNKLDWYATLGVTQYYLFSYSPDPSLNQQHLFHVGTVQVDCAISGVLVPKGCKVKWFQFGVMANQLPNSGWNAYIASPAYVDQGGNLFKVQTATWIAPFQTFFDWEFVIGGSVPTWQLDACKNNGNFPVKFFSNMPLVFGQVVEHVNPSPPAISPVGSPLWDNSCSVAGSPSATFLDETTNPTGNTPSANSWQGPPSFQTTMEFGGDAAAPFLGTCVYSVESWNGNSWVTSQPPSSSGVSCAPGAICCTGPSIAVGNSGMCNFAGYDACQVNVLAEDYMGTIASTTRYFSITMTSPAFQITPNPTSVTLGLVGAGSIGSTALSFTSMNHFAGTIDLATTVSPSVPNGPTSSLSTATATVTKTGYVYVNPTKVCSESYNPSNVNAPLNPKNGQYAVFDSSVAGGGGTMPSATYCNYSVSLPTGATITTVEIVLDHYETGYKCCLSLSGSSGATAFSGSLTPPYRSQLTTDVVDITSQFSSWTTSSVSNTQLMYSDQEGSPPPIVSYLEDLQLLVYYSYPYSYQTSSVTLADGGSDTRTLTISSSLSTPAGTYMFTVTGTSGSIQVSAMVVATVSDFQLKAPASFSVLKGQTANIPVAAHGLYGFSGTISITATPSTGLSCSAPSPSTLTITPTGSSGTSTVACNGAPGNYQVSITAASGSLSYSTQVGLSIQDFTLSANPTSISFVMGSSGTSTVSIASLYGFSDPVSISYSISQPGLTCTPPFAIIVGSGTMSLSCSSSSSGTYIVTLTATSGSLSYSVTITFSVTNFTVAATSPGAFTAGSSATSTITVSGVNGFTGSVSLSATVPASLFCGSPSPTSVTNSGTATISCNSTSAGTYTLTITGTSGSLSYSATATFTVVDFTITASSPGAVQSGASAMSTVTITALNGFSGALSLTDSTPANLSCGAVSPSSLTASGSATVSCSSTTLGTYTLTVTGTSGALSHSATATFTVTTFTDFSITASPTSIIVTTTTTGANSTVTLKSLSSSGTVTLGVTLPSSGLLYWTWFDPNNCGVKNCTITQTLSPGGTTQPILEILPYSNTPLGNYPATITGTSGSWSHTFQITVTVKAGSSGGSGGGSLAEGTMITMADGSKVAVQNIKVGDQMIGYNPITGMFDVSTVTNIKIVHTSTMLVIHMADGGTLRTDSSPTEILWTRLQNGTSLWLPVTRLQNGDDLWTQNGWVAVTSITSVSTGQHAMYDITATMPYFANGYLDPPNPS